MWLSNFILRFRNMFLVLYALFVRLEVWCSIPSMPQKDIEIQVHNDAVVAGENIVLGDVATIYSRSIQDFEKLSALVLSNFPSDKESVRIPKSYIEARVRELLGSTRVIRMEMPETLIFKRVAAQLSPEDLAAKIYALAVEQKKIPDGVELRVEFPAVPQNISPEVKIVSGSDRAFWRAEHTFKLTDKNNKTIWLRANLRWFMDAWVAKDDIKFQQDLHASDFILKNIEVTTSVELPLLAGSQEELAQKIQSARSKRSIRNSLALSSAMIDKKPDLNAGEKLRVIFISDSGLRVEAEGSAMNDALIGSLTKARLKKSKKIISGRLVDSNLIEVSL